MIELILELKQKCRFDSEIGESFSLKEREVAFLSTIAANKSLTSKELSSLSGLSPSRSSRVISALYEKGYILMEHNRSDRRLINISLTQKGKDCVDGIEKEKRNCEFDLLAGLSDDEKATVKKGLNILLRKM